MDIDSPIIHWAIYLTIGMALLILIVAGMLIFRILPRINRIISELKRLADD